MAHRITVVGIGPGNPKYILPEGLNIIKHSEVLVGGKRALSDFAMPKQTVKQITADIQSVMDFISEKLMTSDVTVLVSGDPGYYSLLDALRREFPYEQIKVVPGISSIQYAFSRLALPWHDAGLVSFHGRIPDTASLNYKKGTVLGMLTDRINDSAVIAEKLINEGWPVESKISICSRLSYDDEKILVTNLEKAAQMDGESHCVLVVEG